VQQMIWAPLITSCRRLRPGGYGRGGVGGLSAQGFNPAAQVCSCIGMFSTRGHA
jgi:hypothetical protein